MEFKNEDVYSGVELEIIDILVHKQHAIRVPRMAIYSDEDIRDNLIRSTKGFIEVEWSLSRIIRVVDRSFKVVCRSRAVVKQIIMDILRLIELAPLGNKLPKELVEVLFKADKLLYDLKDSQSYIFRDALKAKEIDVDSQIFNGSKDIRELSRYLEPHKPKHVDIHENVVKVFDKSILRDPIKFKRLDPKHVELVTSTFSNMLPEYKDISKPPHTLYSEYDVLATFVDENMRVQITYEELSTYPFLLKYLSYLDIGHVMRNHNIVYPTDSPDKLRFNRDTNAIEYYDDLVKWYPITDMYVVELVKQKYDIRI